ncbi:hypothetical protein E4U13_004732 [Claviceps humidiphila]|uniref:non-specific serine/threonine protein kinase n=1 Tax=Claviceps humidiphila TaxID=1294629 RepID=A0A9P7PY87_9HYPO|nr:hypothetical protein E4U13_004732 [Claviceps humidiphila]
MSNLMRAVLANAHRRMSRLFVPPSQPPSTKAASRQQFPEEPDNYKPGGYHPVSLGDTFESQRYTILRKLGYGLYSTVWLARDSEECGVIHTDLKQTNILWDLETPNDIVSEYLESVPPRTTDGQNGAMLPLHEIITTPAASEMASLHVRIIDFGVALVESLLTLRLASWRDKHLGEMIQPLALRAPEVIEFMYGYVIFPESESKRGIWNSEEGHLARIIEILGPFPSSLLRKGRRSAEFFDEKGMLLSIALPLGCFAEIFDPPGKLIRIRKLKASSLKRMLHGKVKPYNKPSDMPEDEFDIFVDFLKGMLEIDPIKRKSAAQLLQHEWLS